MDNITPGYLGQLFDVVRSKLDWSVETHTIYMVSKAPDHVYFVKVPQVEKRMMLATLDGFPHSVSSAMTIVPAGLKTGDGCKTSCRTRPDWGLCAL